MVKDLQVDSFRLLVFVYIRAVKGPVQRKDLDLDGIFKVVRSPFVQMFSIHAFITSDNSTTQVPLVFCMMSRRLTSDYKAVSVLFFCFFFFTNCKNYIRHFQLYLSEKHQHVAYH